MSVLMEILLEILYRLIWCPIADARVGGRRIVSRQRAQLAQNVSGGVMFQHHHAHRILDSSKRRKRCSTVLLDGLCQTHDIWKEHLLFLEHVWPQVGTEPC